MSWRDLRGSASLWLAAVSVAVMLLVTVVPDLHDRWAIAGGFIPLRLDIAVEAPVAMLPAVVTPLTASFLHVDWGHLLFNMILLLFCGRFVEAAIGRAGLVLLYMIGAFASALAQYAFDPILIVPMIGASGAISAIFGSFALIYGKPKPFTGNRRYDRAIHAASLLIVWVLIQWMVGTLSQGTVAAAAHVGGFLAGLVAFPLLRPRA
ncbi:rhomboid family intramembrane serine protease [Sphingomicrobium clamense]|uniref:Rhomboid family intramembrane serine protease n=1 Tax=Sphingomicrobium clamense TaxID=2851013 RepID=A0ABS6V699_9SPHN|nr:rhomboid family intramembrane serine protease [Sphingomicrobium sp. B8]MBW0145093.1 rhomboid family intramembrane serine protease [Sphingomicrobium sp. B8]